MLENPIATPETLETTNVSPQAPTPSPEVPPQPAKNKRPLIIFLVVILLTVVGAAGYYLGTHKQPITSLTETTDTTTNPNVNTAQAPTAQPLFTGMVKRLPQDLHLFVLTEFDRDNPSDTTYSYFEAGTFTSGELAGYKRVVALKQITAPVGPSVYLLATKDYQTYILDTTNVSPTDWGGAQAFDPTTELDKTKIAATKTFETEHPQILNLDPHFALYNQGVATTMAPSNQKDSSGNATSDPVVKTDVNQFTRLNSPFKTLSIFSEPYTKREISDNNPNEQYTKVEKIGNDYLLASTLVYVVDSTGLPMMYRMTTPENIERYKTDSASYDTKFAAYKKQMEKYDNKEISEYPAAPEVVTRPAMDVHTDQLELNIKSPLFKSYQAALPGGCTFDSISYIAKVSESDLEQIGTKAGQPVYRLKDLKHPLLEAEYINKVALYDDESHMFQDANPGKKAPTLEQYVSQTPLLFQKDFWGRWVVVGEWDYMLPGGCGKPVVYLYPTKPTQVSVQFTAPMQFTTVIPNYMNGWNVLAQPNGQLTDLQPQYTNCDAIDTNHPGSEYAAEACKKHVYPYLYWAGNVASHNYPNVTQGWIVSHDSVGAFLEKKLTTMGLNSQEQKDFLEYWVPELQSKNAAYYRISFLQTQELNQLFPMAVTPRPDTTFRIFLDYAPLSEKPTQEPQPQQLNTLIRRGFTLVEWGGLKRP